jgi:hypothetical protein
MSMLVRQRFVPFEGYGEADGDPLVAVADLGVEAESIAPGSLGHRVGRGEDACHGGKQREPARSR